MEVLKAQNNTADHTILELVDLLECIEVSDSLLALNGISISDNNGGRIAL
ncbi:MAG: hypothetical protein JWN28_267 [Candidatus Saccharibacteria bacterium]|nr:hypothetical protein [Candidatus Saccharibacteria bacterium]